MICSESEQNVQTWAEGQQKVRKLCAGSEQRRTTKPSVFAFGIRSPVGQTFAPLKLSSSPVSEETFSLRRQTARQRGSEAGSPGVRNVAGGRCSYSSSLCIWGRHVINIAGDLLFHLLEQLSRFEGTPAVAHGRLLRRPCAESEAKCEAQIEAKNVSEKRHTSERKVSKTHTVVTVLPGERSNICRSPPQWAPKSAQNDRETTESGPEIARKSQLKMSGK